MDSLPGTPQIQNIIPTTFFKTTTWAAPWLGVIGAVFIFIVRHGVSRMAPPRRARGGRRLRHRPHQRAGALPQEQLVNPWIAILPLVVVGVFNKVFTVVIPEFYGDTNEVQLAGMDHPLRPRSAAIVAIWAVDGALLVGILTVLVFAFRTVAEKFAEGTKAAVAGALLASMNTASEYGFGAVIAALPGFLVIRDALAAIPNPLVNEAITVTTLAGITGSASGGMSIALAAMADEFIAAANAAGIPARSAAPRRRDGERRHGYAAAQRRGDHAARRHRPHPPPVLPRHLRDHLHQDARGVRGDRRLLHDRDRLRQEGELMQGG